MPTTDTDMNQLVPLRSGLDARQAALLKDNLEGQGVPAFLAAETMGSQHVGGQSELFVRAKNWREAETLLGKIEVIPASRFPVRTDTDGEELICNQCSSSRVHPYVGKVPTFVPGIEQVATPEDRWVHCLDCDSYSRTRRPRFTGAPIALMWGGVLGLLFFSLYFLIQWLRFL
jgi:hypothetical protein